MKKPAIEKNFIMLAVGAFLIFSIGAAITTIFPPFIDDTMIKSSVKLHVLTDQEKRGRDIYLSMALVSF